MAYLVRFGYGFGFSDQDEFLPWLRARLEPGLLANDWFVSSQQAAFNVRSGFVWLLDLPARLLGIEWAVLLTYGASMTALALGVYYLARALGARELGALVASFVALALTPRWTLGGNAAASSMLVPSLLAWSLCVWAVVLVLRKRYGTAGIIVGFAAWIQVLVAAQVGAIILFAMLFAGPESRREALRFSVPSLGLALPLGAWLAFSGTGLPAESFDILARIRAPHHYLPAAFPLSDYAQFGALAMLGLWAMSQTRLNRSARLNRVVWGFFGGVLLALIAGVTAWILDAAFILSLQPFKATVLAQLLLVSVACSLVPAIKPPRWFWAAGLIATLSLWALVISGFKVGDRPAFPDPPGRLAANWVAESSAPDARVAVPPSLTGFRFGSGRSVVVNFKAYPFTARGTEEWLTRLSDWAPTAGLGAVGAGAPPNASKGQQPGVAPSQGRPTPIPIASASDLLPELDRAYEDLDPELLAVLCDRYAVALVLRRTRLQDDPRFELRAREGEFFIYGRTPG